MEGRIYKKWQILFQICKKVFKRKSRVTRLHQAVQRMELHQRTVCKWLNDVVQHRFFLQFRASHHIQFPTVQTTLREKIFYVVKYLNNRKLTLCNSWSHKSFCFWLSESKLAPVWQVEQYQCHLGNNVSF